MDIKKKKTEKSGRCWEDVQEELIFMHSKSTGWWLGTFGLFFHILGMSSSQLTNSYFSEG